MTGITGVGRRHRQMKKNAKSKRADAERATEHYAHEIMNCIRTVRSVRTQWQRQDMFSCDVLGKRADGSLVALQVTAGQRQAVTARKRKLGKEYWHYADTVQLLQLFSEQKGRGKLWFFKVYEYRLSYMHTWIWILRRDAVSVPKEWFKKWRES